MEKCRLSVVPAGCQAFWLGSDPTTAKRRRKRLGRRCLPRRELTPSGRGSTNIYDATTNVLLMSTAIPPTRAFRPRSSRRAVGLLYIPFYEGAAIESPVNIAASQVLGRIMGTRVLDWRNARDWHDANPGGDTGVARSDRLEPFRHRSSHLLPAGFRDEPVGSSRELPKRRPLDGLACRGSSAGPSRTATDYSPAGAQAALRARFRHMFCTPASSFGPAQSHR